MGSEMCIRDSSTGKDVALGDDLSPENTKVSWLGTAKDKID